MLGALPYVPLCKGLILLINLHANLSMSMVLFIDEGRKAAHLHVLVYLTAYKGLQYDFYSRPTRLP